MSLRSKTKRRLVILLTAGAVLAASGAGLYAYLSTKRERETQENRELGLAAVKAGHYGDALRLLARVMRRYPDDAEVLYQFSVARRAVHLPNARHLEDAMNALDRTIRVAPDHPKAAHDLLGLYVLVRRYTEANDLADRILTKDPKNVEAIQGKTVSLLGLRRAEEAVDLAEKAVAAQPDDPRLYDTAARAMRQQGRPNEKITEWLAEAVRQHAGDPRFELVMGFHQATIGEIAKASEIGTRLADTDPPDAEFVFTLVRLLDGLNRYDLSTRVVESAAGKLKDKDLRVLLIRRLYESERFDAVLEQLADLNVASDETPAYLLGLKALTLIRSGKEEEVKPIVEALVQRSGQPQAEAWGTFLREAASRVTPIEALTTLQSCLNKDPDNPYIRFALGDAYSRIGENEAALETWEVLTGGSGRSMALTPSWFAPFLRCAAAYSAMGRHQEAVIAAEKAMFRARGNAQAAITKIQVLHAALDSGILAPKTVEDLVKAVAEVREKVSAYQPLMPIYVDLLARTGNQDKAAAELRTILAGKEPQLTEATLLQLLAVNRSRGLGLERDVSQRVRDSYGLTHGLAISEAEALLLSKGPAAAKQYMESALAEAGDKRSELGWQMASARVLDLTGDGRAHDAWARVVRENPDNLAVQRAALNTRALQSDRKTLQEAIDHIKKVTGDTGLAWRLAQARLLLSEGGSDDDLIRASNNLKEIVRASPGLPEPHLLLAEAQRRLGVTGEAIDQLAQAADLLPRNATVRLDLAQMKLEQGDREGARQALASLHEKDLSVAQLTKLSAALVSLGEDDRALTTLRTATAADPSDARAGLLLAQIYQRLNRPKEAESVYQKLMENPSAAAIGAYADFLLTAGRDPDAIATIARLKDVEISPYEREMSLYAFHRRRMGTTGPEKPLSHLRAAIQVDPKNPLPRRLLMGLYLDLNQLDEAAKAGEEGFAALPQDPVFGLMHREPALVRDAVKTPALRPMVEVAINSDRFRDPAIEALRITYLKGGASNETEPALVTRKIQQLAERYPRFLALQNLLADWYAAHGQLQQAVTISLNTTDAFPGAPGPAERAARFLVADGQWDRAATAAEEWRRRAPADSLGPDLLIAQARINQVQYAKALEVTRPHLTEALKQPDRMGAVVQLHCTALIATKKTEEAENILKPLLKDSANWRMFWMGLAATGVQDPGTAAGWLDRVAAVVPSDSEPERIELGKAWNRLADRTKKPEFGAKGIDALKPLAERAEAQPDTIVEYALLAYQQAARVKADPAQAVPAAEWMRLTESSYRRALEKKPDMSLALNNLAMILADRPDGTDEALKLARKAVDTRPREPSFHDTLAYVQAQRKEYADAARSLEKAVALDPETPEWRVSLADAYLRGGDLTQAGRVLAELDERGVTPQRLAPTTREKLERVRQGVSQKQAAAQ